MNRLFMRAVTVATTLLLIAPLFAQQLEVEWREPKSYTDVKGAGESDARYQKRVFKQFEKHLNKLMDELPEDTKLELTIKDVNLAGDVRYNFNMHREIRLVENMHWPKVSFEYKLYAGGNLVDKGEVTLKDMAFLSRGGLLSKSHDSLKYDKRLFTEWFRETVEPRLKLYEKLKDAVMTG